MTYRLPVSAFAFVLAVSLSLAAAPQALASDCFMCAADSTDACAGKQQCADSREECRKKGCKITGTASCSTAANVKKCEAPKPEKKNATASYSAPIASDCFNCAADSTDACSGKQQCSDSREECRKKGCKITGTASCSTAANVKKCEAPKPEKKNATAAIPWTEDYTVR